MLSDGVVCDRPCFTNSFVPAFLEPSLVCHEGGGMSMEVWVAVQGASYTAHILCTNRHENEPTTTTMKEGSIAMKSSVLRGPSDLPRGQVSWLRPTLGHRISSSNIGGLDPNALAAVYGSIYMRACMISKKSQEQPHLGNFNTV